MIYPCHPGGADDYVALVLAGDSWDTMLAIMGRAELIGDERYATDEARRERPDEVYEIICGWTATEGKYDVMRILTDVGIPCGAVQDTREILADPHLREREMVVELDDPVRGKYPAFGCPIKIASNPVQIDPPPLLGEHSAEVLSSLLGFGSTKLSELQGAGVI